MIVLPAIIPRTKEQLEKELKKVSSFAQTVQVDISDGLFTPYKTWPYNGRDTDFFEELKAELAGWPQWEKVNIELHLMVKSPEEVLEDWVRTGVISIVAHVEATDNFQKVIDICRESAVLVGIAIKPSTDITRLEPFAGQVDFIQVMGSDLLGKHGVPLDPEAVEKIKTLRALYPERIIAVDIGVSEDTEEILTRAGATKLISGSSILNSSHPESVFRDLETPN